MSEDPETKSKTAQIIFVGGQDRLVANGHRSEQYGSEGKTKSISNGGQQTTVFIEDSMTSHERQRGSTLSFHGVNYTVGVPNKGCCKGSHPKRILIDVK